VNVHYVGVAHSTGEEFDASYNRGAPLAFQLGVGQVIQGWDQGIPGMKVGGRRVLVIPADLAYGAAGSPPTIPANAPLVFVVDLKKIAKS
jgi:peptidylprolyl isomerase